MFHDDGRPDKLDELLVVFRRLLYERAWKFVSET